MARFAIIAPPLRGHVDPLMALARELVRRGHRVSLVHQSDAGRHLRGAPVDFIPVGARSHPPGTLDAAVARMGRLNGPSGLRAMIRGVAADGDMLCREAPAALRDAGTDAVLADQAEGAGALVAARLGVPCIETITALPLDREPGLPPPWTPWLPRRDDHGIRRDRGGWRVSDWLMRPIDDMLAGWRDAWGVAPAPVVRLAQAVRELDFPREREDARLHWLGPWREPGLDDADPDLPPHDGRPLVFCSLGTLQGNRRALFARVATACDRLGLRLLLAHGGGLDATAAARLPGHPIARDFVPQRAVLRHAAAAVTHAGFNTVLDALSFGVPMVAMPLAFEQPGTGARLRRAGAAEVVAARWPFAGPLVRALARVTTEPDYAIRAGVLARAIASAGGVQRAADLAEAAVGIVPAVAALTRPADPVPARAAPG